MKTRILVMVLMVVICLFLAVPLMAWNDLGKVRDFLDMKMYNDAYELLNGEKGILKKSPKDLQAQILLGVYYLGVRNDTKADERFTLVLKQDARFAKDISKAYKDAAQDASERKNITLSKTRFQKAIAYNPVLVNQAGPFFVNLGDKAQGNLAVECYRTALYYTKDQKEKTKITHRLLCLAIQGIQTESIKKEVALIIGQAKVDEIFPLPYTKTIFEKTYTDADIDKNGYIYTFTWGNRYKKGDFIEIIGEIPEQKKLYVKEIYYYRGKHCTPDWGKTDNGYRKIPINYPPENGKFVIWIEKGKGIKAKVRVRRKVVPKPRKEFLASL